MGGLRKLCRLYGRMKFTDAEGKSITYVWDYVADAPVPEPEMPFGSDRWKASEQKRFASMRSEEAKGQS